MSDDWRITDIIIQWVFEANIWRYLGFSESGIGFRDLMALVDYVNLALEAQEFTMLVYVTVEFADREL